MCLSRIAKSKLQISSMLSAKSSEHFELDKLVHLSYRKRHIDRTRLWALEPNLLGKYGALDLTEELVGCIMQAADGPQAAQAYLAKPGPGALTARSILSEAYLRRLSKLPLDDTEDKAFD